MSYGVEDMHGNFHENVNNKFVPGNRPAENTTENNNSVPRINNAIKIQNFGGSLDEDVGLWLFAFKNWQLASVISENSTLVAIAANHLTKNALSWFKAWCAQSESTYSS
ncbi:hypothetical protein AYI70_g3056 [Smittium culicis]|uniref:Retrotransposon gag domain-containing protein n=1 Tax=Smittium culicis TaxID=133412 RepID=A0A1R1Y5L8_9FUNG|nr:hypothetical protein AYI70_g3056 [Smittium culicis]